MTQDVEQRLTFIATTGERSRDGHLMAKYRCACGNESVVIQSRVKNGYTRSCGCLASESKPNLSHGMKYSREYKTWSAMRVRCLNPNHKDYPRWGGRGITICDRWSKFEAFYEDMGPRPHGTSIDRIDPNGNYEPGNCRWATALVQARNRSDLTMVTRLNGEKVALVDYAKELGITRGAAHLRLKRGTLEGILK